MYYPLMEGLKLVKSVYFLELHPVSLLSKLLLTIALNLFSWEGLDWQYWGNHGSSSKKHSDFLSGRWSWVFGAWPYYHAVEL